MVPISPAKAADPVTNKARSGTTKARIDVPTAADVSEASHQRYGIAEVTA